MKREITKHFTNEFQLLLKAAAHCEEYWSPVGGEFVSLLLLVTVFLFIIILTVEPHRHLPKSSALGADVKLSYLPPRVVITTIGGKMKSLLCL